MAVECIERRAPVDLDQLQSRRLECGPQRGDLEIVLERVPPARTLAGERFGTGE